ncbi:hypothetical protein [Mycobacterium sp.]|uniref:hypothetical protein n=1 Tax=Mycobacterium sp. TaxID=1785 RepID=UPI003A899AC4
MSGPSGAAGLSGPSGPAGQGEPLVIDCDNCAARGPGCRECVVTVLLGAPETLSRDEQVALEALAEVGLAPRLRLVPIRHAGALAPKGVA